MIIVVIDIINFIIDVIFKRSLLFLVRTLLNHKRSIIVFASVTEAAFLLGYFKSLILDNLLLLELSSRISLLI